MERKLKFSSKEWDLWFKTNADDKLLDEGPSGQKNSKVIGAVDTVESVKAVARGIAGKGNLSATDLRRNRLTL